MTGMGLRLPSRPRRSPRCGRCSSSPLRKYDAVIAHIVSSYNGGGTAHIVSSYNGGVWETFVSGRLAQALAGEAAEVEGEGHAVVEVAGAGAALVAFGDQPHHVQPQTEVRCVAGGGLVAQADQ